MKDFIMAVLPWICMGLALAIFFAQSARRIKNEKETDNYGSEGMALGMCFGVAIGTAMGINTGIGLSLGMLLGFAIGLSIEKNDGNQ